MPKGKGRQDPFGNYFEWAEHRYDPGHYLGGTIQPHLRKSDLGPRARRRSGALLVLSGLGAVLFCAMYAGTDDPAVPVPYWYFIVALSAGLAFLNVIAGMAMFRASGPTKRRARARRRCGGEATNSVQT